MKKIFAILAMGTLAFTLMACGGKKEEPTESHPDTPAWILYEDFESTIKANKDMTTEEMAEHLIENEVIVFGPAMMPVEEGYLNGFKDEITGFSEGTMFGPMIGSIPFVGYVFKSDDNAALMKELTDKGDLAWNVCTQADEMVCKEAEGMVYFVMAPASFDE